MKTAPGTLRLRVAINVTDPSLAVRIASVFREVEGIEIVEAGCAPDAIVVGAVDPVSDSQIPLTARELEVLALLAEGASNKAIGQRLGISANTAKFHVASLLDKLDAVSRTDAVAHAARLGVLHL